MITKIIVTLLVWIVFAVLQSLWPKFGFQFACGMFTGLYWADHKWFALQRPPE